MKQVSIIIVSYNTKDLTRNCLLSIYEKTKDVDFEVFVVDNNSSDGSAEMIEQEFPKVKLIKSIDNRGFGAANNIAIKKSEAKYVFLLNPDTILLNNAVKIFVDYMEQNPLVGACGGNLYDKDMNEINVGGHFYSLPQVLFYCGPRFIFKNFYKKNFSTCDLLNRDSICEIDNIIGADLFIRKAVLDEIGIFDENYFMYIEETDLQYRIAKNGYKIMFIPDSKIIHLEGASSDNETRRLLLGLKSLMYYFRKNKGFLQMLIVKILYTNWFLFAFIVTKNSDKLKFIKVLWE